MYLIQKEKELLLKDLCARLPYGVIVRETFQNATRDVSVWDCGPYYIKDHPEKVKPYLRPMSSMTEEEKREWTETVDWKRVGRHKESYDTIKTFDFYHAHHFDYRGLIEKGLAMEAPEEMYKF